MTDQSDSDKKMPPPSKGRRDLVLAAVGGAAISTVQQGISGWMTWSWDKLKPVFSDVEVRDLFPSFASTQLCKGEDHPTDLFHSDVKAALIELRSILVQERDSHELPFEALPDLNRDGSMVLLGGPISNLVTRELHGHTATKTDTGTKISEFPTRRSHTRWHFYYPQQSPDDPSFVRYVDFEARRTWPKKIVDLQAKAERLRYLEAAHNPQTGFIKTDYLLITCEPNHYLGKHSSGNTVVEVSDLHGQGDKAFARLLRNPDAKRVLMNEVRSMKQQFQALYRVPVLHNHNTRTTEPGVPELIGVAAL